MIKISGSVLLLNLAGGVALLLCGLRFVRIGVTDGWGNEVRTLLGKSLSSQPKSFLAGLVVTILLQSSSATALLTASFSGQGLLTPMAALAVLLGADVGTTLVAQIFTFDLSALSPSLIVIGFAMFNGRSGGRTRAAGRMILGLGLMLLALKLIVLTSLPMRESEIMQQILQSLSQDLVLAVIVGALIATVAHSSLATILLIISITGAGVIEVPLAFALVLGANVGAAAPAIIATSNAQVEARWPPLGNLLFRLLGVACSIPLIPLLVELLPTLGSDSARQIVNFHTIFNLGLAILCFPLVGHMSKLTQRLLPHSESTVEELKPMYLNVSAFETPLVALINAERETLHMGEIVERMFRNAFVALKKDDRELARNTRQLDDTVDTFFEEIKLYLTSLSREPLGNSESKRSAEILSFATDLEHIGDIISVSMIDNILRKKIENSARMPLVDRENINKLYNPVLENFRLALVVLMSRDIDTARQLIVQGDKFRKLQQTAATSHLQKLYNEGEDNADLSALQLDVIRDLQRINSQLSSIAYSILEDAGHLRRSRLRKSSRGKLEKTV